MAAVMVVTSAGGWADGLLVAREHLRAHRYGDASERSDGTHGLPHRPGPVVNRRRQLELGVDGGVTGVLERAEECARHVSGRHEAVVSVDRQRAFEPGVEREGKPRTELRHGHIHATRKRARDVGEGVSLVGEHASQRVVDADAQREQIAPLVEVRLKHLLGAHVLGGPDGSEEPHRGAVHRLRDAEVEKPDIDTRPSLEEQVLCLDVAVKNAAPVGRSEGVARLFEEHAHLGERQGARALDSLLQGLALEQLEHEERQAMLGDVEIEHAHDVGAIDPRGRARLAVKEIERRLRLNRVVQNKTFTATRRSRATCSATQMRPMPPSPDGVEQPIRPREHRACAEAS